MKSKLKIRLYILVIAGLFLGFLSTDKICAAENPTSGKCGDNATWSYNAVTQTLTISGSGKMYDYPRIFASPSEPTIERPDWYIYKKKIKKIVVNNGITRIGNQCFYELMETQIELPTDTLLEIGEWAFTHNTELESINIPETVNKIESDAFNHCAKIKQIRIPGSVKILSNSAFVNCFALKAVVLEEGVTTIQNSVFNYGTCVDSYYFPSTLESIGEANFESHGVIYGKSEVAKEYAEDESMIYIDVAPLSA